MQRFIKHLHESARSYTLVDFGMLKLCLFSIGLWIGIFYARPLYSRLFFIKTIAFTSTCFIMYTTFRNMYKHA